MEVLAKMEIPERIAGDYLSGNLDISNAVARSVKTGRIDSYITLAPYNEKKPTQAKSSTAIAVIAGVAVALVGGLITYVIKKKDSQDTVEIPEYISKFHSIFQVYLKEAKEGRLDIATICELIEVLDEIDSKNHGDFSIDFSATEIKGLFEIILNNTKRICAEEMDLSCVINTSSDSNILTFKKCLNAQKEHLENVA